MAKKNPHAAKHADYMDTSQPLGVRVAQYLAKGGKPEYQDATTPPPTLAVYDRPLVKDKNGLGTFDFYKSAYGGYTANPEEARGEITLDKKTGDINITAPQQLLDSELYKQSIASNMDVLKQWSAAYKKDKNVKIPNPFDDQEENDISIPELVKKMDSGIKEISRQLVTENAAREEIRSNDGDEIADKLTTNNFIKMSTVYDPNNKNKSRQAIPKLFQERMKAKGLEIDNLGTALGKDVFDKYFSHEKSSRDEINSLTNEVNEYFRKGDFSDADEYASMVSFRQFLADNDPTTDPWNWVLNQGMAIGSGVVTGLSKFATGTLTGMEGVRNAVVDAEAGLLKMFGVENAEDKVREFNVSTFTPNLLSPSLSGVDLNSKLFDQIALSAGDDAFQQMDLSLSRESDKYREYIARFDSGASAMYALADLGAKVAAEIVTGAKAGSVAANAVKGLVSGSKLAQNANKAIQAAEDAAGLVSNSKKAQTAEAFLRGGGKIEDLSESLQIGARAVLRAQKLEQAAESARQSIKVLKAIDKVPVATVDITSQAIVDAAIDDPQLMRQLLDGNSDDYSYIMEQFAWNVGGWGAGVGLAKGVTKVSTTYPGRVANAVSSKYINKGFVGLGNLNEKVKSLAFGEDWIKNIRNADKKQIAEYNKNLRAARSDVAKEKVLFGEGGLSEGLKRQEQNMMLVRDLSNKTTAMQRGVSAYVNNLNNYSSTIGGHHDALNSTFKKIQDAEKAIGISPKPKGLRRLLGRNKLSPENLPRQMSVPSANYLGTKTQLMVLDNIKRLNDGKLTKELMDGQKILLEMQDEALDRIGRGSNLQDALDEYFNINSKWYTEFDNVKMEQGIVDAESIRRLRKDGVFRSEEDYIYSATPRAKDFSDWVMKRTDGMAKRAKEEMYSYNWGSKEDFLDPIVARYNALTRAANTFNATEYVRTAKNIKSVSYEVKVSPEDVSRIETVNKLRSTFERTSKQAVKSLVDVLSTGETIYKGTVAERFKQALRNAKADVTNSKARVSRHKVKPLEELEARPIDRKNAILGMTDTQIDDLLSREWTSWNEVVDEQSFRIVVDAADDESKKLLKAAVSRVGMSDNGQTVLKLDFNSISTSKLKISDVTYDDFRRATELEPDLIRELNRTTAKNTALVRESSEVSKLALDARRAAYVRAAETIEKKALDKLKKLNVLGEENKYVEQFMVDLDESIDEFVGYLSSDRKSMEVIDAIIDGANVSDKEIAKQYLLMKQLKDNFGEARKGLNSVLDKELATYTRSVTKKGKTATRKLTPEEKKDIREAFKDALEERVVARLDEARRPLLDEGSELVQREDIYSEVQKLQKTIEKDLIPQENVIAIRDESGGLSYVKTDPILADIFKFRPDFKEMGKAMKFFNTSSKLFRLGTTGMNLVSIVNQTFQDTGNAFIGGNMFRMTKYLADDLVDPFGQRVVDELKRFEPEQIARLIGQAEETGQDVARLAVEREFDIGRAISPSSTETAAYRYEKDLINNKSIKDKGAMASFDSAISKFADTAGLPNEIRERFLRNGVYQNAFYDAMKSGRNLKDSRIIAQFVMDNATTNFAMQMYHLRNFQKAVPYLGAAVNGTKSFWRLFSLDPVGVTSRFMAGLAIPAMALTGGIMNDAEAREKYEQLNEYEKNENLIFAVNGQLMKIPMPQELGALVAPFRQFVEHLHGANRHTFQELMLNNAINISPLDFDGFVDIDHNRFQEDPNFFERIGAGAEGVLSQTLPPVVKSGLMLITGRDPYTGRGINKTDVYVDPDTGDTYLMDSSQDAFAQWFTQAFGQSGSVAQACLEAIFGTVGGDVLNVVTRQVAFFTGSQDMLGDSYKAKNPFDAIAAPIVETVKKNISKPMTVADYDRTAADWRRETNALWEKKNAIIEGEEYKKVNSQIARTDDPEVRKKLIAKKQSLLEPFYKEVSIALNKLVEISGPDSFDMYRQAAILSLLNPEVGKTTTENTTAAGRLENNSAWSRGQAEATDTLARLGADFTGDRSILGYIKIKDDGTSGIVFNTPLEILAMQNAWYKSTDTITALVEEALKFDDGFKKQKKAVDAQIDAIRDKGNLTSKDYEKQDAIRLAWNAKVVEKIDPIIKRFGPNQALRSNKIMDLLDDYLLTPSEYMTVTDKRGRKRYVSSGNGKLNKSRGFAPSYIRKIYGVKNEYSK